MFWKKLGNNILIILIFIRNINSVKASLKEIYLKGELKLNGDFIYNNKIVALFYFRTGYSIESFQVKSKFIISLKNIRR